MDSVLEDCLYCVGRLYVLGWRTVCIVLEDSMYFVGVLWIVCCRTVYCDAGL